MLVNEIVVNNACAFMCELDIQSQDIAIVMTMTLGK